MAKKKGKTKKKSTRSVLGELGDFHKDVRRDLNDIIGRMATKGDLARLEMSMLEELNSLRKELASETDIEKAKDEIMSVLRPMQRAQDKDALTVVSHENRIVRIEEKAGLIAKK